MYHTYDLQGWISCMINTARPLESLSVKLMAPYTKAPLSCNNESHKDNAHEKYFIFIFNIDHAGFLHFPIQKLKPPLTFESSWKTEYKFSLLNMQN